jgi:hypothetical protein
MLDPNKHGVFNNTLETKKSLKVLNVLKRITTWIMDWIDNNIDEEEQRKAWNEHLIKSGKIIVKEEKKETI